MNDNVNVLQQGLPVMHNILAVNDNLLSTIKSNTLKIRTYH